MSALRASRITRALVAAVACVAVVFVAVFFPSTPSPAQEASTTPAQVPGSLVYRLGSGDRIKVTVFGHEDLSGEFEIDGSGRISLPLIQEVIAAGRSVGELETDVTNRLRPDYLKNPRVSVEVLNYRPFYIFGEVNEPGSYAFVNGMTIVNAIAMAGGYTYRARENRVLITRANDASRTPAEANHDTPVLPGDVIEVPERFF